MNLEKLLVCPSKGPFEKASMVDWYGKIIGVVYFHKYFIIYL